MTGGEAREAGDPREFDWVRVAERCTALRSAALDPNAELSVLGSLVTQLLRELHAPSRAALEALAAELESAALGARYGLVVGGAVSYAHGMEDAVSRLRDLLVEGGGDD